MTEAAEKKTTKLSVKDKLFAKKQTVKPIMLTVNGEQIELTAKALPENEYRDIRAQHPPKSKEDKAANNPWNSQTFPAALLAAAVTDPAMSAEEWTEIWESKDWSFGELQDLFTKVLTLTMAGFDVPFGESV